MVFSHTFCQKNVWGSDHLWLKRLLDPEISTQIRHFRICCSLVCEEFREGKNQSIHWWHAFAEACKWGFFCKKFFCTFLWPFYGFFLEIFNTFSGYLHRFSGMNIPNSTFPEFLTYKTTTYPKMADLGWNLGVQKFIQPETVVSPYIFLAKCMGKSHKLQPSCRPPKWPPNSFIFRVLFTISETIRMREVASFWWQYD